MYGNEALLRWISPESRITKLNKFIQTRLNNSNDNINIHLLIFIGVRDSRIALETKGDYKVL
jgi:hypothetical protein